MTRYRLKLKWNDIGIIFLLLIINLSVRAQKKDSLQTDTGKHLHEVIIKGYLSERPLLNIPASAGVLSALQLSLQTSNSLVNAMNTIPGVRMEERSPGSYRLSIRGSTLRSPFGVRDVKVYFDEIPLTDAGGNTYLNAIDINSIKKIEVLKGPDGSLFGANSGGVVILNPSPVNQDNGSITGGINGGSYNLIHENTAVQEQSGRYHFGVDQAYENYGGYRQNSNMQRNYLQTVNRWDYAARDNVKLLAFYSGLNYQTPGGLTLAQSSANPQSARLATLTIASATALNASIDSKMLFGGFVNTLQITPAIKNVTAVFDTHVNFTNPSFTTYEHRDENTYGVRTYFELTSATQKNLTWKANFGLEYQQTNSAISNYGNKLGNRDTAQSIDNVNTNTNFIFSRFEATVNKRLIIETALSLNNYQYQFQNLYPLAQTGFSKRPFNTQLMPRLASSYQLTPDFVWRASVSRGYSTPTIAEVRATNHIINPDLQAQDGWNYETGFRLRTKDERFLLDASVFYYRLNKAIVQRTNTNETTYFVNAGGTDQPGAELLFTGWVLPENTTNFIRGLQLNENLTYTKFTFRDYVTGTINYNGNNLTGVPAQVSVSSVYLLLPKQFYVFAQYNFTAKLPLNDANTVYAGSYHLVDVKTGWRFITSAKMNVQIFAGADNLLNQAYSLGNDVNAAANRFYNPAPTRNYYAGVDFRF